MSIIIDAVIIDTSAYMNEQSDFIGLNSAILPSLFQLLEKRNITLLAHEILNKEIIKNIHESELINKLSYLKETIKKYKTVLPLIDLSVENITKKIDSLSLEKQLIDAYQGFYKRATLLPYPSSEKIFSQYFAATPPFAESGNKKSEFPDAFVIESLKQYQEANTTSKILVISCDPDWQKSFKGIPNISLVQTISDGIKIIQKSEALKSQKCEEIFELIKDSLGKEIVAQTEYECFELNNFNYFDEEGDFEVVSVEVTDVSDIITPLKITENSILIRTTATLKVSGRSRVLNENESYWDKEDGKYLFVKYNDISFENGESEVECEISIEYDSEAPFDPDEPISDAWVDSVRLNVKFNIEVDVDDDDIIVSDPEQDAFGDMMDALEDYHRR